MGFRDLELRNLYRAVDDRLDGFYVPVLKEAVAYDRLTGYFRSSALVAAAAGLSHFLAHGGRVRLIAGADLSDEDVEAIERGEPLSDALVRVLLADPMRGTNVVADHRLETLAWLVREGRLDIRIGVPVDHLGRPLRRDQTERYFHSKYGVLTDAAGDRIAFLGSDNESASGWRSHHETFAVYKSWHAESWSEYGAGIVDEFERHWQGDPGGGWAVVDLPDAVRDRLVSLAKDEPPPARDPEERRRDTPPSEDPRLRFVAVAPRLGGGSGVGFVTAGVEPWPHQLAVAQRAIETFPRGYLLADEVGLGKTIEAGLILRELLVSGRIETALLLVPASVIRQWQEELAEKFALRVPRYEGCEFLGVDGEPCPGAPGNPWRAHPVLLASSHLARRRARHDEILAAGPWDVVLVDEAHHARRSGAKASDSPNRLLELLQAMRASRSWKALYLLTATPMQMHTHEAWDLVELLGLPGRWGSDAATFERYYMELREPFPNRQWAFLSAMAADHFSDPLARRDEVLEAEVKQALGLAGSNPIRHMGEHGLTQSQAKALPVESRHWMDEWLRAHTPMRDRVFRTTRHLLRRYKADGLLDPGTVIPIRSVADRFVPMTKAERALYDRIESYISRHYNAYMTGPKSKRPLGFIMTVYRRRLTSSFLAIERSLRRRLDTLLDNDAVSAMLVDDDLAAVEMSTLFDFDRLDTPARLFADEVDELRDFLAQLSDQPPDESKMQYLHDELHDAFTSGHETVIVFTQYTDTMDYVRDQLRTQYGPRVACYSGRGGERWDPTARAWCPATKEEIKTLFREGREIKVLVGTDAMSEGLNLQTCGKLINYDMPWNFMRVEQRIGRVDRIGGQPRVEVSNYFYRDTVEEQIYHGISEDFDWFEQVVGPAQPVLNQVERAIEEVAMTTPGTSRDRAVLQRVEAIRAQIQEAKMRALTLGDLDSVHLGPHGAAPAIDLAGLERVLTTAPATAQRFHAHPTIPGAYLLEVQGRKVPVTMRRDVLDEHAPTICLLTYGTPELDELFAEIGLDLAANDEGQFTLEGQPIGTLSQLETRLE